MTSLSIRRKIKNKKRKKDSTLRSKKYFHQIIRNDNLMILDKITLVNTLTILSHIENRTRFKNFIYIRIRCIRLL